MYLHSHLVVGVGPGPVHGAVWVEGGQEVDLALAEQRRDLRVKLVLLAQRPAQPQPGYYSASKSCIRITSEAS